MSAWAKAGWYQPIPREVCGRISDSFLPCTHKRPCPIHDRLLPERAGGADKPSLPPAPPFFKDAA